MNNNKDYINHNIHVCLLLIVIYYYILVHYVFDILILYVIFSSRIYIIVELS